MLCVKVTVFVCLALFSNANGGSEGIAASNKNNQNCTQNGYEQHGTGCYKLHDTAMTWDSAKNKCATEGGYLVIINDKAEAEIISDITKDSSFSYDWVGLRDESGNDDWRSVHGDRVINLYNVWAESERRKYKCGAMKYTGVLDNVPCTNEYSFVCEKNIKRIKIMFH